MEHLIETIEKFLAYSDQKLEELAEKISIKRRKSIKMIQWWRGAVKKLFAVMLIPFLSPFPWLYGKKTPVLSNMINTI